MEINKVNNLAKSGMTENNYTQFMAKVNNKQLNDARLFIGDRMDEIIFNNNTSMSGYHRLIHLKKLDDIITNEYINQIDVKDAEISK